MTEDHLKTHSLPKRNIRLTEFYVLDGSRSSLVEKFHWSPFAMADENHCPMKAVTLLASFKLGEAI